MGGMAVRDGSFLRDGAVFPIDCDARRNTLGDIARGIATRGRYSRNRGRYGGLDEFESLLSSHANRVVESSRNLIPTEVCEFYIFGLVLATGPGQTTSIR